MKGQLTVDTFIAMFIFVGFVVYIFFQILSSTPSYINQLNEERLRAEAFQISEILINDPGEPIDWHLRDINSIKRIGLSDSNYNKTNLVSLGKATKLNTICSSNYDLIKTKLDIYDKFSLSIIKKQTGTNIVSCQPSQIITAKPKVVMRRLFVFNDSSIGELTLQMW
ncbi:MAG: hypothetical protein QXQ18_00630 [Candidatus Aenigmatarchaeota archaeon]